VADAGRTRAAGGKAGPPAGGGRKGGRAQFFAPEGDSDVPSGFAKNGDTIDVFSLSRVLHDLQREGYPLEPTLVAALSLYLTLHIHRFGRYDLDMDKRPPELVYDLWS